MDAILLHGVKTHNLKNFDMQLAHRKFYVVTGVSGSGKSSLAFDTLYAEGQRRYVESLSAYARQFLERMEKPDVESVSGIPPSIAIQAKNVITNARSTVGTQTEINDYLRIFFARVGKTICPNCDLIVGRSQPKDVYDHLIKEYEGQKIHILFKVALGKKGKKYLKEFLPELERQGFYDFFLKNKPETAETLLKQKNIGESLLVQVDALSASPKNQKRLMDSLELAYRYGKGEIFIFESKKLMQFSQALKCFSCGMNFKEPSPNFFSFNSPLGACSDCQGFGRIITLDWDLVIPDAGKSLADGAIEPWTKPSAFWEKQQMLKFCQKVKIPINKPWKSLSEKHKKWILEGKEGVKYFSVKDFFEYLEKKTYKMHVRIFLSKYRCYIPCATCQETRLKEEALYVKVAEQNIHQVLSLSISDLYAFLEGMEFDKGEKERVEPVYIEMMKRVRFLKEVGLGYLTLTRLSRTLSGGEVQRIHLATSLGSALVDTLYVLDEPSIGLHERDNQLLIRLLKELRDLGNTVVVVEHDQTMIEAADEIIDLGPTGGEGGGELLFQGKISQIGKSKKSLTGQYLLGQKVIKRKAYRNTTNKGSIKIRGAVQHNLKSINVEIPFNQLVLITGVSGSGKSTFLYEILYRHYQRYRGRPIQDLGEVKSIKGFEGVDEIVMVDQTPIGRSPRSNPVTYIKVFDEIRKVFARTHQARAQGYEAGKFSFNVDGGRCDSCKGDGRIKVEMHFLADVFVRCEACQGTRYKDEILKIQYRGKNIDQVLSMSIDDAYLFFEEESKIQNKLDILRRVGLGYLRLGQSATTLSGGEAQRLKLAVEMSEKPAKHILYLFDEPTTGLHYHDIHYLLEAFEEMLTRGHSIVVIEHNMEIIRSADYVIDLGPEGGKDGGEVLYQGQLEGLQKTPLSYTGKYLKTQFKQKQKAAV